MPYKNYYFLKDTNTMFPIVLYTVTIDRVCFFFVIL